MSNGFENTPHSQSLSHKSGYQISGMFWFLRKCDKNSTQIASMGWHIFKYFVQGHWKLMSNKCENSFHRMCWLAHMYHKNKFQEAVICSS